MKILIANSLYAPEVVGGAEVSTQIMAEGLVAAGHDVSVVCATASGPGRTAIVNGVRVHYLRYKNLYWPYETKPRSPLVRMAWHIIDVRNFAMHAALERVVASERPDVVATSNLTCLSVDIWRIGRASGAKVVHTLRDYYLLCPNSKMFARNGVCEKQCGMCTGFAHSKRAASANVDALVGVSRFILSKHVEYGYFPHASRSVINDCFLPGQCDRPGAPLPMSGSLRLGILGRVAPEKGIDAVAAELLKHSSIDWRLSIAGNGEPDYVQSLQARLNDPRITFLGHVDPEHFLDSIDVLIVPSRWHEPFGRVIVEAYSQGIPVVGAKNGAIPEIIAPFSRFLFDIERPEALVDTLRAAKRLRESPDALERLRAHARSYAPDGMVDAYVALFNELQKTHNPALEQENSETGIV